jgi:hypothetical protein
LYCLIKTKKRKEVLDLSPKEVSGDSLNNIKTDAPLVKPKKKDIYVQEFVAIIKAKEKELKRSLTDEEQLKLITGLPREELQRISDKAESAGIDNIRWYISEVRTGKQTLALVKVKKPETPEKQEGE